MATADLSFDMRIVGTPQEISSILDIMFEYDEGKDGAYFSSTRVTVGDKSFYLSSCRNDREELLTAVDGSGQPVEITACGPFGSYDEIDDVGILRDMAKAAPGAHFTASIEGFAGYADQSLRAELANGLLNVSTFYLSDDDREDARPEYMASILPFEKFFELFRIDSELFDKDAYEDFVFDILDSYESIGEYFEETDYEEFIEALHVYDAECTLTREEFDEAVEHFADMDCGSFEDFLEKEGYAYCDEYTFDPADENNSDNGRRKMVSGTVCSVNENIREYLQSIGHPSDDEAINALSVEDVYAILAGTYGKESSDAEEAAERIAETSENPEENPKEEHKEETEEEPKEENPEKAAESEAEPSSPKRNSRAWLIVLLVIIALVCAAGCAMVLIEPLRAAVMNFLDDFVFIPRTA